MITKRHLTILLLLIGGPFSWNIPVAFAQFAEAGVVKFKTPVEAPDFTLKELGGEKVSLKELRGKVVLINFFAYQ